MYANIVLKFLAFVNHEVLEKSRKFRIFRGTVKVNAIIYWQESISSILLLRLLKKNIRCMRTLSLSQDAHLGLQEDK